jgi:hypothetical protein
MSFAINPRESLGGICMKRAAAILCVLIGVSSFAPVLAGHGVYALGRHFGPIKPNDPCLIHSLKPTSVITFQDVTAAMQLHNKLSPMQMLLGNSPFKFSQSSGGWTSLH